LSCIEGHDGPECTACSDSTHDSDDDGVCESCPSVVIPAVVIAIIFSGTALCSYMMILFLVRPPASLQKASQGFNQFLVAVRSLGPSKVRLYINKQCRDPLLACLSWYRVCSRWQIKSAVTFYQIIVSFRGSFDLDPVNTAFTDVFGAFEFINFDWSEMAYPRGCLDGGYTARMLMVAFTPLIAIVVIPAVLVIIVVIVSLLFLTEKRATALARNTVSRAEGDSSRNTSRRPSVGDAGGAIRLSRAFDDAGRILELASSAGNADKRETKRETKSKTDRKASLVGTLTRITSQVSASSSTLTKRMSSTERLSRSPSAVKSESGRSLSNVSSRSRAKSVDCARRKSVDSFALAYKKVSKIRARFLQILPLVVLIVFVMLPSVSRTIFSAWDCVAYKSGPTTSISYIRRDVSVECGSEEHNEVVVVAFFLVLLWPIGMQFLFFSCLYTNRKILRTGEENAVSRALRFLTGGYKPKYFYCERSTQTGRKSCDSLALPSPHRVPFRMHTQ
jgi:hypothetical protein